MVEKKQETKKKTRSKASTPGVVARSSSALTPSQLGLTEKVLVNPKAYALWIRALLQNWRQGTVSVKTRAQVAKSRKKPWKQKGTGRARVGSARSPLWRGGGIIFGPQARTRTLKVPRQLRGNILSGMLYHMAEAGRVHALDFALPAQKPSTAAAGRLLREVGMTRRVTVLVRADDLLVQASFVNIPFVQVLLFDQLNAFDLSNSEQVVVLKNDVEQFKEMVTQWI